MNSVEKVLWLHDIEFLSAAPTESLARLALAATHEEAPAGAHLFHIGERPGELLLLVSGQVTLTNQAGVSCRVQQTGLDFLSVLCEVPHIVTARAATKCSLLRISAVDLVEIFSTDAEFSWQVLRYVASLGLGTCSGRSVPEYPPSLSSSGL